MGEEETESKNKIVKDGALSVNYSSGAKAELTKDEAGQSVEVRITADEQGEYKGLHDTGEESVGAYEETKAGGHASLKDGVSVGGGAIAGDGVTAGIGGGMRYGKTKVEVSSDVSVGDQIGATGSCHATIKDGVLSIGVKGKVAALIGLKGDVNINIDTKAVANDGKSFVDHCNDAYKEIFG